MKDADQAPKNQARSFNTQMIEAVLCILVAVVITGLLIPVFSIYGQEKKILKSSGGLHIDYENWGKLLAAFFILNICMSHGTQIHAKILRSEIVSHKSREQEYEDGLRKAVIKLLLFHGMCLW